MPTTSRMSPRSSTKSDRECPGAPRLVLDRVLARRRDDVPRRGRFGARRWTASSRSAATCRRNWTRPRIGRVGRILVCHGTRDEFYTDAIFDRDIQRLRASSAGVHAADVRRRTRMVRCRRGGGVALSSASRGRDRDSSRDGLPTRGRSRSCAGSSAPAGHDPDEDPRCVRRSDARPWMRRELQRASRGSAWVAVDRRRRSWVRCGSYVIEKIPNPIAELEKLAYLSNLYVRPSARGGIGTRLLETRARVVPRQRDRSRGPVAHAAQRDALHAPRLRAATPTSWS